MLRAILTGFRRVLAAPAVVVGVYLMTLAVAVPFALVMRDGVRRHLGTSLMADGAVSGVDWDWWQEFTAQAAGLETTLTPAVIGFAVPLDNLSALIDRSSRPTAVVAAAVAYASLWLFLWGGILDRYARARTIGAHGFFAACGVFFFRFLRLGVIAGILYGVLFGLVHEWLFGALYRQLTQGLPSERVALAWRVGLYVIFGTGLILTNVMVDYAKIRAVVEDRRSMIGAFAAGARFVARQPFSTISLYLSNGVLFLAVLALYGVLAPGVGGGGLGIVRAFLIGQAYVLARLVVRLTFAASQTCLFQSRLAHAAYTATPDPVWPESPAAEAIVNAAGSRPPPAGSHHA